MSSVPTISALILATCFIGSFAGVVNINKCSESQLPEFIHIEGCEGHCTVQHKSHVNVRLAINLPINVTALRPAVTATRFQITIHVDIPEKYKNLCDSQGCPIANETKVYDLNVWVERPKWIIFPITPKFTVKLHDQNGKEVMCALFPVTIK